ncbi:MAG: hypothetical protein KF726_16990 [Anaerolineae bacterium]|nr:hypothetical protein [Anaerolineae bacterium]
MTRRMRWLFVLLLLALVATALNQPNVSTVYAEALPQAESVRWAQGGACEAIVQQALELALQQCKDLERGQACYANIKANVEPKSDVQDFRFDAPGDRVAISDVNTFKLSAYNEDDSTWGVIMMRAQANLPGVNIGQAVTMLVFGDTQITDANGDGTMQSVYLKTGTSAPGCAEMPRNGVLLQTPKGAQKVEMDVNGVQLKIGSTIFLTADGNEENTEPTLWLYTLEGSVDMTSDGVTVTVPQGTQNCVPLRDEDPEDVQVVENGPPCSDPEPLDPDTTGNLPTDTIDELGTEITPTEEATTAATAVPTRVPTRRPTRTATVEPTITGIPSPLPPPPSQTPTYALTPRTLSCAILSFTASPSSVQYGDVTVNLSWETSNAIAVEVLYPGGDSFGVEGSGNYSFVFGEYGLQTQTWGLRATCNDGVTTRTATVTYNPPPEGTQSPAACSLGSFTAAPNPANIGTLVTLNWTTTGAVGSVTITPPTGSPFGVGASGTFQYNAGSYDPMFESWGLTVTCVDSTVINGSVTVTVQGLP